MSEPLRPTIMFVSVRVALLEYPAQKYLKACDGRIVRLPRYAAKIVNEYVTLRTVYGI